MSRIDTPLAIVGNALSVVVAATERARRGLRTVVVNPGGPWGAYFAGVQADGRRWDAGMVAYEFTSFRETGSRPALATYDPMVRNDIGRFVAVVQDYVQRRQSTRVIQTPQMWIDGRWLPDLLLSNGLSALPELGCAAAARAELAASRDAADASPWHARRKNDWAADGRRPDGSWLDCETVSRINHGQVLHEAVFAPFAHQVLGRDASHLAALYHRIPWLPLYWPETLRAWLEGRPQPLPPTEFSYPVGASVADLCATLGAEMVAAPEVDCRLQKLEAVEAGPAGYTLRLADGATLQAKRLAWALSPHQGLAACGQDLPPPPEQRLPLLLGFLRLPRAAVPRSFSVVHAAATDTGLYRVNHVSDCAGEVESPEVRLVVEAHPEVMQARHGVLADDAAVLRAVLTDLARLGIVREGATPDFVKLVRMAGALPLPTAEGLAAYAAHRAALLQRLPGIETIGNSAGPFATALSDQIVQGLALADDRNDR